MYVKGPKFIAKRLLLFPSLNVLRIECVLRSHGFSAEWLSLICIIKCVLGGCGRVIVGDSLLIFISYPVLCHPANLPGLGLSIYNFISQTVVISSPLAANDTL